MDAARQKLSTGDFRQDAVSDELVREQIQHARLLRRIARRMDAYDRAGALIIEAVARRASEKSRGSVARRRDVCPG